MYLRRNDRSEGFEYSTDHNIVHRKKARKTAKIIVINDRIRKITGTYGQDIFGACVVE